MKNQLLLCLCFLIAAGSVSAAASDAVAKSRGQLLFENHCTRCHTSVVHTRTPHRVNNLNDLSLWVKKWSDVSKLDWNEDEIRAVADYLNTKYYHLQK